MFVIFKIKLKKPFLEIYIAIFGEFQDNFQAFFLCNKIKLPENYPEILQKSQYKFPEMVSKV